MKKRGTQIVAMIGLVWLSQMVVIVGCSKNQQEGPPLLGSKAIHADRQSDLPTQSCDLVEWVVAMYALQSGQSLGWMNSSHPNLAPTEAARLAALGKMSFQCEMNGITATLDRSKNTIEREGYFSATVDGANKCHIRFSEGSFGIAAGKVFIGEGTHLTFDGSQYVRNDGLWLKDTSDRRLKTASPSQNNSATGLSQTATSSPSPCTILVNGIAIRQEVVDAAVDKLVQREEAKSALLKSLRLRVTHEPVTLNAGPLMGQQGRHSVESSRESPPAEAKINRENIAKQVKDELITKAVLQSKADSLGITVGEADLAPFADSLDSMSQKSGTPKEQIIHELSQELRIKKLIDQEVPALQESRDDKEKCAIAVSNYVQQLRSSASIRVVLETEK